MATSSGTAHPVLPPSVEEAYRKKCIELRRRKEDVEESNDAARLRRVRLIRGIHKMRLERAILLDTLEKRMRKNGAEGALGIYDEESEDSSDSPPTPQERPLRTKKAHRRTAGTPPPEQHARSSQPPPNSSGDLQGSSGMPDDTATSFAAPADYGLTETPTSHPLQPSENFQNFIIFDIMPTQEEFAEVNEEAKKAYAQQLWSTISDPDKASWKANYDQQVDLWWKYAESQRNKAANAERRKVKASRKSESAEDVDMAGGDDDGVGEGQNGFASGNR